MKRGIMVKKLSVLCLSIFFCGSVALAADSAGNRKDQTARLGLKTGIHMMYLVTTPFVLEFPGEDWTFGVGYGSGDLEVTTTSVSSSGSTSTVDKWTLTTTELTGRYYIGNSFNIPFGVAMYNVHKDDWKHSDDTIWEIDYNITQFNLGIGNDWTFDFGGYIAADWVLGGAKLSDKITVKQTSGSDSDSSKTSAEEKGTDIGAFSGVVIATFGFGF